MGIGYGRAARLIDYMAEDGIVGEFKSGIVPRGAVLVGRVGDLRGGGEGEAESAA